MTKNQHVEKYLNAYRKMDDVDFAVMITGSWGCGKTHFIKDYLDQECTHNEEKKYIYVSLNGVASTADIDMALFQAAHPVLGSKLAVTAGKIFKASVKAGLKLDLDVNNDGTKDGQFTFDPMAGLSLAKFNLSNKGRLLVFDDLERCLLGPEEVLGYINAFVENRETKVVLIGEEDHLNKTSEEKYRVIKEKVIGKTFRLSECLEEIFEDLVSAKALPNTHEILQRNKEVVVAVFQSVSLHEKFRQYNYRALKHTFRDFEYFYPNIEVRFCENEKFINALCKVFVALSYEVQLANLSPCDIYSRGVADELAGTMAKEKGEHVEKSKFDAVLERHGLQWSALYTDSSNIIFLPELWRQIFSNDWVDVEQVSEAIQNSPYFPRERPEWIQLCYWRRNEDAVTAKALEDTREKLGEYAYTSCGIIMHVFSVLVWLSDEGAIDESKEQVFEMAEQYLGCLVDRELLEIPGDDRDWRWGSGSHGVAYCSEGEERSRLYAIVESAISKAEEKQRVASVASWLKDIQSFDSQFLTDVSINGKYSQDPILKYITPNKFLEALEEMPNQQKWLVGSTFEKRCQRWAGELKEELPFWEDVQKLLTPKLEQYEGLVTPSIRNLKDVEQNIKAIIKMLQDAGQKRNEGEM